jgi:hypothetical protein
MRGKVMAGGNHVLGAHDAHAFGGHGWFLSLTPLYEPAEFR